MRHWFDLINYAYATGDTRDFKLLSGPRCDFCSRLEKDIQAAYTDGGRIEGGRIDVVEVAAPPQADYQAGVVVTARIKQEPLRVLAADGRVTAESPEQPEQNADLGVQASGNGWTVLELARQ